MALQTQSRENNPAPSGVAGVACVASSKSAINIENDRKEPSQHKGQRRHSSMLTFFFFFFQK